MPDFGPAELAIILVVVVLIFGSQRIGELGGSLGKGIRDFRRELKDDSGDAEAKETEAPVAIAAPRTTSAISGVICANCDTENAPSALFCNECGKPLEAAPAGRMCSKCQTSQRRRGVVLQRMRHVP